MKTWIYSWVVYPFLYCVAWCFGFFKIKIRETLKLRTWKDFLSLRFNVGQPIEYWIHVASHGELEYAIPILEELQRRKKKVLVTYYSISAKGPVEALPSILPNVSLVVPLPHDGLGLMKEFVSLVHGQGVRNLLLLKYELWPGLLWECNKKKIKVFLVDALNPSWFHRRLIHKLDGILAGYSSELSLVRHENKVVLGDTRVERVLQRVQNGGLETIMSETMTDRLQSKRVMVCGSMWPQDTKIVLDAARILRDKGRPSWDIVWVPHELDEKEAIRVTREFKSLGFSTLAYDHEGSLPEGPLAIIVMKKGILAELYRLGKRAYVGGAFGRGVHSVWEPALSGSEVACGPRTERSPESRELASRGRLIQVSEAKQLADWLDTKPNSGDLPEELLSQHVGAAGRILDYCEGVL